VILLDANLLLYAAVESFGQHEAVRSWLDERLNGTVRVAFPWSSVLAFVRIASNPRVFERPASVADAWQRVTDWLDCAPSWIPEPTERHREILDGFLRTVVTSAKLVPDAHLAALAIEHGLTLCTTDGDFARFPGLRLENPLTKASGVDR
jgi:toxin-antitoxin system PIN domain toxin